MPLREPLWEIPVRRIARLTKALADSQDLQARRQVNAQSEIAKFRRLAEPYMLQERRQAEDRRQTAMPLEGLSSGYYRGGERVRLPPPDLSDTGPFKSSKADIRDLFKERKMGEPSDYEISQLRVYPAGGLRQFLDRGGNVGDLFAEKGRPTQPSDLLSVATGSFLEPEQLEAVKGFSPAGIPVGEEAARLTGDFSPVGLAPLAAAPFSAPGRSLVLRGLGTGAALGAGGRAAEEAGFDPRLRARIPLAGPATGLAAGLLTRNVGTGLGVGLGATAAGTAAESAGLNLGPSVTTNIGPRTALEALGFTAGPAVESALGRRIGAAVTEGATTVPEQNFDELLNAARAGVSAPSRSEQVAQLRVAKNAVQDVLDIRDKGRLFELGINAQDIDNPAVLNRIRTEAPDIAAKISQTTNAPELAPSIVRNVGEGAETTNVSPLIEQVGATTGSRRLTTGGTETALRDLLGGEPPVPRLSRIDRLLNTFKRTIGATGISPEEELTASTVMRTRRELRHVVDARANAFTAEGTARVHRVFQTDDLGRIQSLPGAPTIQDIAARLPLYADQLTPEQMGAMRWMEEAIAPYSRALKEQGVDLASRPDIVKGGFYLPRGRAALEGADEPMKFAAGGRTGTKKGFERAAVFESMSQGIDKGYRYAPFDAAMESYAKDAGKRVIDAYGANLFRNATDETGRLLGETPQARLLQQNPALEGQVNTLREKVRRLGARIDNADRRMRSAGMEEQRINTALRPIEEKIDLQVGALSEAYGDDIGSLVQQIRNGESKARILRRLANSPATRKAVAAEKLSELEAEYARAQAELSDIIPQWKKALDRARQMPRGQGSIGFSQLQGISFPDAVANAANKYLRAEQPWSGPLAIPAHALNAANNLLRGLRATADASFLGIQGLLGLGHKPTSYGQAMKVAVKSVGNRDALGAFLIQFNDEAARKGLPSAYDWIKAGLRTGGADTEFMIGQGFGSVGQRIAGAPVIRQSNRAFGYFGDTLRLHGAQGMFEAGGRNMADLPQYAEVANLMTGWSKGRFLGDVGNLVQFAPRFFQSQLELLATAVSQGGAKGSQARQMLIKMIGIGTLLTVAANESIGNKGFDYLSPTKDGQLNPNFMRIRYKGQDISLFGPWDSLLRAMVTAGQGDFSYLARTKASPSVQIAWDSITGRTFTGEKISVETYLRGLLPFSLAEIGKEGIIPTAIGITGVKSTPMTPREQLQVRFREKYNREFNPEADYIIASQDPELSGLVDTIRSGFETTDRLAQVRGQIEQNHGLPDAARRILAGEKLLGPQFVEDWQAAQSEMAGAYIDAFLGESRRAPSSAGGKALRAYRDISPLDPKYRDPQTNATDWDAYTKDKDAAFAKLSMQHQQAIKAATYSNDPDVQKVEQELKQARDIKNKLYDQPKWAGMSAEDSNQLLDFMDEVAMQTELLKRRNPNITQAQVAAAIGKVSGRTSLATVAIAALGDKLPLNLERMKFALDNQELLSVYFPDALRSALPANIERKLLRDDVFQRVVAR